MPIPPILSCGTVLSCLLMGSVAGAQTLPIKLFDLGYTLKMDSNNRDQIRMAWDHCHAVAALPPDVARPSSASCGRMTLWMVGVGRTLSLLPEDCRLPLLTV
jgi:hypothetical protein